MSRVSTKIRSYFKSLIKVRVIKDSPPSSTQSDNYTEDMGSPVCELPAENTVDPKSLSISAGNNQWDEWLGEKYMEYSLAHLLLRHTSGANGKTSLNGYLVQELAAFRYDNCYEQLRSSGIRQRQQTEPGHFQGQVDFKDAILGWIGAILRRGTREERAVLDRVIINNAHQDRHAALSSTEQIDTTIQTTTETRESQDEDSPPEDFQNEIWLYTKTLQERFAGKDNVPLYHESRIREHPPKFRAEVTYRGQKCFGEAGNKKMAKHRASKKLCESLSINVSEK